MGNHSQQQQQQPRVSQQQSHQKWTEIDPKNHQGSTVELTRDGKTFNHCSGALIDYRHVITSASCTNWDNQQPTHIVANEQPIEITGITRHPRFVSGKHYNDIAVLRLDKFYNPHKIYQIVAPSCIWNKDKIPEPIAFYSGYGPDSAGSSASHVTYVPLKILTAFYLDNGRCNTNYSAQFAQQLPGGFNGDFVCGENPVDLVPGICRVEPGGPISNFRRDNVVPYVYGVNTLGGECGGAGNLFVATRVSSYYRWIESIVLNRTEKVVDSRFDDDERDNDVHLHPVVNRGDFPSESHFVSYILPGLIASDKRLKPYGSQFTPVATASIHRSLRNKIDDDPVKLTIYGAQLDELPSGSENILQTLRSIPVQNNYRSSSDVQIIKSIELPVRQPYHEFVIQRPTLTSASTLRYKPVIPQPYIPLQTNSVHYQRPAPRTLLVNPLLSSTSRVAPASESFSIVKSIELHQDGQCTLSSGQPGRCVHYSYCSIRASSYCSTHLLTVCCPV
ncbi:prostasin-like [Aedes albopictus]|uniref:Peptidase S1 domain-containing protein n=1 Tax=Aedes albopictus TaxID=7160 RepID=A0ABM1ZBW7_AEDAL